MIEMNFGCEAEIFCSELRFKMFSQEESAFKGNIPLKTEDLLDGLKARLNKMIEIFQAKLS